MVNSLSPGIEVTETDFSYYVKRISTSAAGFVGVTEKGPINEVGLVTSWEQFLKKYGGYITSGYLAYAARSFFDNGGHVLYVNRIAHYTDITDKSTLTALKSQVTLKDGSDVDTLNVSAINEGVWGDGLSVEVTNGTLNPSNEFDLVVKNMGQIVEYFRDLSMDDSLDNFIELKINGNSEYITVQDLDSVSSDARPTVGLSNLSGGYNGLTGVTDIDYMGDSGNRTGLYAFDAVEELNMAAVPGVATAAVIESGLTYCENRKDCIFIGDVPVMLDPLDVIDFRKGEGSYSHAAFNFSYGAMYYPWLNILDLSTSKSKLIPPSGAVCGCIARSDANTKVWYAPAGEDRGRVFNVLGVGYKTSKPERDVLYQSGVNVIANLPESGVCIWGQKTLKMQPSALDRINVRRLLIYLEQSISKSSRFIVFEPHRQQTWRALERLINPFLRDIQDDGGLYDFAVQCDEETNTPSHIDRGELVCRIFVKPVKTAEFVELNFVLVSTGGSFTEIFLSEGR